MPFEFNEVKLGMSSKQRTNGTAHAHTHSLCTDAMLCWALILFAIVACGAEPSDRAELRAAPHRRLDSIKCVHKQCPRKVTLGAGCELHGSGARAPNGCLRHPCGVVMCPTPVSALTPSPTPRVWGRSWKDKLFPPTPAPPTPAPPTPRPTALPTPPTPPTLHIFEEDAAPTKAGHKIQMLDLTVVTKTCFVKGQLIDVGVNYHAADDKMTGFLSFRVIYDEAYFSLPSLENVKVKTNKGCQVGGLNLGVGFFSYTCAAAKDTLPVPRRVHGLVHLILVATGKQGNSSITVLPAKQRASNAVWEASAAGYHYRVGAPISLHSCPRTQTAKPTKVGDVWDDDDGTADNMAAAKANGCPPSRMYARDLHSTKPLCCATAAGEGCFNMPAAGILRQQLAAHEVVVAERMEEAVLQRRAAAVRKAEAVVAKKLEEAAAKSRVAKKLEEAVSKSKNDPTILFAPAKWSKKFAKSLVAAVQKNRGGAKVAFVQQLTPVPTPPTPVPTPSRLVAREEAAMAARSRAAARKTARPSNLPKAGGDHNDSPTVPALCGDDDDGCATGELKNITTRAPTPKPLPTLAPTEVPASLRLMKGMPIARPKPGPSACHTRIRMGCEAHWTLQQWNANLCKYYCVWCELCAQNFPSTSSLRLMPQPALSCSSLHRPRREWKILPTMPEWQTHRPQAPPPRVQGTVQGNPEHGRL